MSDAVKWGLLAAGLAALVVVVMSLPFVGIIDANQLSSAVATFVSVLGPYLRFARGLANNLFSPWARNALTVVIGYMITKPLVLNGIKLGAWALHFVYK